MAKGGFEPVNRGGRPAHGFAIISRHDLNRFTLPMGCPVRPDARLRDEAQLDENQSHRKDGLQSLRQT